MADEKQDQTLDAGGAYEIIRKRLESQGSGLKHKAERLNARRLETFGSTELAVAGSLRVRTEHNCVPRDIVAVGELLLFGYNVFIGLKTETQVADVFSLHRFNLTETGPELDAVEREGSFLEDPGFTRDFHELYKYYKNARLVQLRRITGKLLAVFQTGSTFDDLKVFRWAVAPDGGVRYIDDRGNADNVLPASHDFEWQRTGREQHVLGKHPHINILNTVFVECLGGTLTIKVEDNTETGEGLYTEPVEDRNQTLQDADIQYAQVGTLIVLRILPYRERQARYFVFNTRTHQVDRIDEIGTACIQLPEDHGLIFPGGYYLQSGETKRFDTDVAGMHYKRTIRSPNGEDVLYVFYHEVDGRFVLLSYNLIRKALANPLVTNGYAQLADGHMVLFRAEAEPTRVHNLQVWRTPFFSDEHAAAQPTDGSPLARLGNAELVRAISDVYSVARLIEAQRPSLGTYEDLIAAATRVLDTYHWLGGEAAEALEHDLKTIRATAEQVLDEFEKVESIRRRAQEAVNAAQAAQRDILSQARRGDWDSIDGYVQALARLRGQRGTLISLKDLRHIDIAQVEALEAEVIEATGTVSEHTVQFLLGEAALAPYLSEIDTQAQALETVERRVDLKPIQSALDAIGEGLNLLTEVLNELQVDDATARAEILDRISNCFGRLNQAKAGADLKRKALGARESVAEFGAQFRLLGQSVTGALAAADTPDKADDQLSRLLLQLEEMEGRFGEHDQFAADLAGKREEIYEAFETRKQQLLDAQQRRSQNLAKAAERILQGLTRRAQQLDSVDALNGFFASDAMALKVRGIVEELRTLKESVRAEDIAGRIKSAQDQAVRALRDKLDIYEEGGNLIRLGRHRFSVNTQEPDLTLVPHGDGLALHIAGTDYFEAIDDPELEATRPFWEQALVSETAHVYRGEYLADSVLTAAEAGQDDLSMDILRQAMLEEDGLVKRVQRFAEARYDEGYERGVHDHDAARILEKLIHLRDTAGLLRYGPLPRSVALLFWAGNKDLASVRRWSLKGESLGRLTSVFGQGDVLEALGRELTAALAGFIERHGIDIGDDELPLAGRYLAEELQAENPHFVLSGAARKLADELLHHLDGKNQRHALQKGLGELADLPGEALRLAQAWLEAFVRQTSASKQARFLPVIPEAAVLLVTGERLERSISDAVVDATVEGLLGQHPLIHERSLHLRLPTFIARLAQHRNVQVTGFHRARALKHAIIERQKRQLRIHEFKPTALTSFVRNKLINDLYLPLVGDNLAKQMGAAGAGKRTDLMGLLLVISPPGYGKTTLMEYVASRLGLMFVKVNCPTIGHEVTSLDPAAAPNAAARQELEKLNLALEMGNNVMLILDDIQHSSPELLQKFISLCDGQRRIEGVWRGRAKTYDLRGKKFCVVMAGNPYTESGEAFKIPDMLANRADVYNLGDVLSGHEDAFRLSYIENTLTSNAALAPLATREMDDFYKLVRMARGEQVASSELRHNYSTAEINEIVAVLKHLFKVQQVLLAVNQQYIASAAQDDAYRTEPPFRLQGSYRNMNRLAEKIVAAMNEDELDALVTDHYVGEAQTLTIGAEENLLKLAELRGNATPEQQARWDQIKKGYVRRQALGGEDDPTSRLIAQLNFLGGQVDHIAEAIHKAAAKPVDEQILSQLRESVDVLARTPPQVEVHPVPGVELLLGSLANTIESSLLPVVRAMSHKLRLDHDIWDTLNNVLKALRQLDKDTFKDIRLDAETRRNFSPEDPVD